MQTACLRVYMQVLRDWRRRGLTSVATKYQLRHVRSGVEDTENENNKLL